MTDVQGDVDPRLAELLEPAWEAYRLGRTERAIALARHAVESFPEHGDGWWWLGCALERSGRLIQADRAFLRATKAKSDPCAPPYRVSWARFQRSVDLAADALPAPLQTALKEVTLCLADYALPVELGDHEDPELMGLFEGAPRGEPEALGELSPRIHLWRRSHEHAATTAREFDAEVRQTLLHELGHYLGYDEDELEALGRG